MPAEWLTEQGRYLFYGWLFARHDVIGEEEL